jgi:hypothetical protein
MNWKEGEYSPNQAYTHDRANDKLLALAFEVRLE